MTQQNPEALATREPAMPERTRERPVFSPRTDIFETEDHVVLVAEMPGVAEKAVEVTLENDVLTIRGNTEEPAFEGMRLAYAEYRTGDYQRSFVLGDKVAADRIEASMKNGILRLSLPEETPARRKIPVTTG